MVFPCLPGSFLPQNAFLGCTEQISVDGKTFRCWIRLDESSECQPAGGRSTQVFLSGQQRKGERGKTWDTMLPAGMIAQDDRPLSSVVALSLTMLPKWDGCPRWLSEDMGWDKMTPSPTTLLLLILGKGALIIISAVVGISFNYHESGHSDTSPVGGVWIIDVAPN